MAEREPPDEDELQPDEGSPAESDEDEIKDPFERETIRYSTNERVLAVTLDGGPKIGRRSIDVFLLSEFLGQIDRVVRGLSAWARGIPLESSGRIPTPDDAAPWRSRGVVFGNSATLDFVLGQPEAIRLADSGALSSPTLEAIAWLGHVMELDASAAVDELREVDDRIGRDFTRLIGLLADNELQSRWEPHNREPVNVPAERADRVRAVLRSESEPASHPVEITGFLYQLDAKKHDFKIQPEEGDPITGSYDDALVDELRDAWRHRVVAEVIRTERRYTYATHPHKVDHSLKRILERLELVDE